MVTRLATVTGSAKGQLSVEVSTSAKVIHRGDDFTVDINVTNTLDQDVEYVRWSWTLPAGEFGRVEGDMGAPLASGSSRAITFPIRTSRPWWAFGSRGKGKCPSTGTQVSHFNLVYKTARDGERWQSVPVTLDIRAAPWEIYEAAVVGGVAGSLVNTLSLSVNTLASGILGLFLVLIAQRREDVQLGVSVEDALGGLVVGFLVGYLGTSYFKGFLPKT
jgi:hypothetical protein